MNGNPVNSYNYPDVYQQLNIDISKLGCIMLSIDSSQIPPFKNKENLYENENGTVESGSPHVTLLFGLLKSGTEWKAQVDKVLEGWSCDTVTVDHVDYFNSAEKDKPYYVIVAKILITPNLQEGHDRLSLLPHIDSFAGYVAHMTIAYIVKDDKIKQDVIDYYDFALKGKTLKVVGIDYGDKPGGQVDKSVHYCMSCKDRVNSINIQPHKIGNNRMAEKGQCPKCGTNTFRFLSNQ